jgi:CPA2 family monovalent cation:H+ antiporter-2
LESGDILNYRPHLSDTTRKALQGDIRLEATIAHEAAGQASMIAIAVVVAVAALLGLGFMRLRQPPLVGFILAGITLGPTGAGLISNSENVTLLAEMGVILLLFFIGMELSIKAFVFTLRGALTVAMGQIAAAMILSGAMAFLTGAAVGEAIILGFIIALSSTVVAMKMLDEMGQLRGEAGRIAVAVLIAQDLAVVPMLIFVSSLGGASVNIGAMLIKIVVAAGILGWLLWWLGRRPKLRFPFAEAIEDKIEILALGSLALCFAAAAVSGLAGLSPVYGAFIAGILVGNSTLRSRVIPVIEPIQSVLLVVFFLSIGLLIDLDFIWDNLWEVLGASILVVALKTVVNVFLLRKAGYSSSIALIAGLSMSQIGEFSFVLASAGLASGALGFDLYRLAISVTALSLLLSPIWISIMHRLEDIASEGLRTYREQLAVAYHHEIDEVAKRTEPLSRLGHALRVRYRAIRLAIYHRRAEARKQKGQ